MFPARHEPADGSAHGGAVVHDRRADRHRHRGAGAIRDRSARFPASTPDDTPTVLDSDPLHAVELADVRTGESFTLGALAAEKPVLLELMAIWCTSCRAQQPGGT